VLPQTQTQARMALLSKLSLPWLIGAFAVGLLLTYLIQPKPRVVIKFPSPYNAGKVLYRDEENTCFRFRADKVSCPRDKAILKPQPLVLEDFGGGQSPQGGQSPP
jgi:hypothetical protein